MQLTRSGSKRNHGTEIVLHEKNDQFVWNKWSKKLKAQRKGVRGGKRTHHDYTLDISLFDFARMLDQVTDNVFRDSREELAELMASRVDKLQLLMMCALGYPHPEDLYHENEDDE